MEAALSRAAVVSAISVDLIFMFVTPVLDGAIIFAREAGRIVRSEGFLASFGIMSIPRYVS
ncbi:hypothetical protein GCM10007301_33750 [Azorhizobium oxalatiphilum]|uniref:Uncharacterized protein n=1 Tax=Azorhizobium oxalatiphilum TaxID=980631 RepID=A0A917FEW3_9HYPH|nr:hypothetical protein GCM10007301_33750 [Azorhizobium oxalatiphilum]